MANCVKIRRTSSRVCIGGLDRKIIVNTRSIVPPSSGGVDFTESFSDPKTVWAMIETVDGVTIFDDTNTEQVVTHNVYIRYFKTATPEKWVKLIAVNGIADVYLNIIRVENFGEENRFYRLRCNLRGNSTLPTNWA